MGNYHNKETKTAMNKTDLEIRAELSLLNYSSTSHYIDTVMQAARTDERLRIREIMEKRIADAKYLYDSDTVDYFKTILNQIK